VIARIIVHALETEEIVPKYRVQQIVRVLSVIRVEAEGEQEAFEKADSEIASFLPKDTDSLWVMGIEDGSVQTKLDDGESIMDIGYSILGDEE